MKTLLMKYLAVRAPSDMGGGGGEEQNSGTQNSSPAAPATLLGGVDDPKQEGGGSDAGDTAAVTSAAEQGEYVNDPNLSDEENAAKKAEHDAAKAEGDEKPDDNSPIDPQSYDLSAPEGYTVDPEVEADFRQFAADNGLSTEVVGKLKEYQVKMFETQAQQHAATVTEWGNQIKTDPEIGGKNLPVATANARRAMKEFFPPEAREILEKTGLGNHPAMVKGMARIGSAMGEGTTVKGAPVGKAPNVIDNWYGEKDEK